MNVYQKLTSIVCELLTGVQYSLLSAAASDLNVWTSTNQQLVANEVSNPICQLVVDDTQTPPTVKYVPVGNPTSAQKQLIDTMNDNLPDMFKGFDTIKNPDGTKKLVPHWLHSDASATAMENVVNALGGSVSALSQAFGAVLMQLLQYSFDKTPPTGGNPSTGQQTTLSSINQLVVSQGQADQQIGGNAIKTQGSEIQTLQGNSSNESELNTTVQGSYGNIISLLNQSYA